MPEPAVPEGTWLGFDFGLRRIGVAVGQNTTRTATALATLSHNEQPDWAALEQLLAEWKPVGLVVGLPLDREGRDTDMSRAARRFGARLEEKFACRVFFIDERLTSVTAGAQFAQARSEGRARRKDGRKLDAAAARIILENWLQAGKET
jgi:putative Holliday junction resolvase